MAAVDSARQTSARIANFVPGVISRDRRYGKVRGIDCCEPEVDKIRKRRLGRSLAYLLSLPDATLKYNVTQKRRDSSTLMV
jgi:hypothetical protein